MNICATWQGLLIYITCDLPLGLPIGANIIADCGHYEIKSIYFYSYDNRLEYRCRLIDKY